MTARDNDREAIAAACRIGGETVNSAQSVNGTGKPADSYPLIEAIRILSVYAKHREGWVR